MQAREHVFSVLFIFFVIFTESAIHPGPARFPGAEVLWAFFCVLIVCRRLESEWEISSEVCIFSRDTLTAESYAVFIDG